jgi:hypothetical protein
LYRSGKKKAPTRPVLFSADSCSLGFEFTTGAFTVGFGALDPTLTGTGNQASAAGGSGGAGTGARARIYVGTFAAFFTSASAHRCNGEHDSCSCSERDSGGLLSCNHLNILKFIQLACTDYFRYASLEDTIFSKVHRKSQKFENV